MDWRDWLNISGFALTVVGFGVTFETLRRTKNAAERSKEASEAVIKRLLQFDAVVEISKAIIERSVSANQTPENSAALNRVVSAQIDSLSTILVNLREEDWTQE